MFFWRLSGARHAASFAGGYGLQFDGRWNSIGLAVTYCATSPALCVLEKLVHVEDAGLLPDLVMVTYEAPVSLVSETIALEELPPDWIAQEASTQQMGDAFLRAGTSPLLRVPSAVVPLPDSLDVNVLINHAHPASAEIRIARMAPYRFDPRLL